MRAKGQHQNEDMVRYVQDEEIRRCEYLLRVYRTSLRGEREILTNLLKLHEQRAKPLDDMALRKQLAENVSRADEL